VVREKKSQWEAIGEEGVTPLFEHEYYGIREILRRSEGCPSSNSTTLKRKNLANFFPP